LAPWIAAIEDASMPSPPPAAVTASDRAVEALRSYLEPYFAGRRQPLPGQLLARLAAAAAGQDSLSRVDLMDNSIGLFPAGAETTTGLIGNAVSLLLDAPGRLEMARGDQAMAPDLIEEALRLESPINAAYRWVAGRVTVDSGAVQAGRVLILSLAAANRDPRAFIDPAQLDIQRRDRHPHVAFGAGRHVCLGAHLARLECEVTLRRLLHRYRTIEAAGPRIRKRSVELRCLARLPVRVVRQ
jgi:cytochrome P450